MLGNAMRNVFLKKGYFVSKLSSDSDVSDFVGMLKPYDTDKRLIRIGGEVDGGYLIPNDLVGIDYCFSPGVAETAGFEIELAKRGIRSFLADYSVDRPPVESEMFHFEKRYLGAVNNSIYMTLEAWIAKTLQENRQDLILQMDIEGNEYDVILATPESIWRRFRIVVVEFHGLHTIFNQYGLKLMTFCFRKLLEIFDIVHIHPNNVSVPLKRGELEVPSVMEMSFLRKDRVQWRKPSTHFPNPLDRPSVPSRRDLVLPACWYR